QSLNDLAELYRTQSVYAQAEPLHQRALAIREQVLGPDHPAVAQSLNNLAELYRTQSVYAQAKPLYQQSLAVYLVSLGIEHPTSRTVLQNYEGLLQEMGKTEAEIIEALQSLKQQHMHEAP
ncbi:MAG: tetratricopeptide repeat protein, partial [Nitrospira sp.]